MASKIPRKGRNPGAVDNWLDTLGLYRKNVAYDETCLFRAVSEQIFDCQVHHERVRRECILYAREHHFEFMFLFEDEDDWNEHLDLLEKHMVVCGDIEIEIVSRKYNRDVIVFDAAKQQLIEVTKRNLEESLLLCLMDEDHYDVVYGRDHIVTAGFCQSIIYKILYENVFHIENVDEIVNGMLYDKTTIITQGQLLAGKKVLEMNNNEDMEDQLNSQDETDPDIEMKSPGTPNIAPFPFKVAKALDPTIYRNIEYDSWGEVRREMRLGDWYYGDDKLILGTRCILSDYRSHETYECYIQEILKDANKCVVYLTKLAERRTVDYADLAPEDNAKPWPLPYRFSKNLVIGAPPIPDKSKVKKKSKDKRRTKSWSESSGISNPTSGEVQDAGVSSYVGLPLQMHTPTQTEMTFPTTSTQKVEPEASSTSVVTEIKDPPPVQETSSVPSTSRYQWDNPPPPPQWHFMPPTPEPFVWPSTPTTPHNMFNYNLKPMVASAPVTPDVVPYHDPNFPFYYSYHVDPQYAYPQWSPQTGEYFPQPEHHEVRLPVQEEPKKQEPSIQMQTMQYSTNPIEHMPYDSAVVAAGPVTPDRPTVCTTLTPPNPPMEMFSPLIQMPTGTPVIYTQDMEMMMSTTPITVYTPTMDIQYVQPPPYVYPPTPPTAWYPAPINSQGFIFPTPMNTTPK